MIQEQLPVNIMKKAARGISYIAHPLRLRILEYLDVYGVSSVTAIARGIGAEQVIVSQNLRKLRDAGLIETQRRGIFIYYKICEEYPASIFTCIRKMFGFMANDFKYLADDFKAILPRDYTNMVANQIKLFANYDKMRILEFLIINGESNVTTIISGIKGNQIKVSQYLKRLYDDNFVNHRKEGRYMYYAVTKGVHKTALECIRRRYDKLDNKGDF